MGDRGLPGEVPELRQGVGCIRNPEGFLRPTAPFQRTKLSVDQALSPTRPVPVVDHFRVPVGLQVHRQRAVSLVEVVGLAAREGFCPAAGAGGKVVPPTPEKLCLGA